MIGRGVHAAAQVDRRRTDGDAVLAIVDSAAVGKDVDVGTLGSEFAVALQGGGGTARLVRHSLVVFVAAVRRYERQARVCLRWDFFSFFFSSFWATYFGKVFANILSSSSKIVTEGACIAGLARALAEEFAWDVGCVCEGGSRSASRLIVSPTPEEKKRDRSEGKLTRRAPGPVESLSSGHWAHHAIGRVVLWWLDVEAARSRVSILVQIGGRHGFVCGRESRGRGGKSGLLGEENGMEGTGPHRLLLA